MALLGFELLMRLFFGFFLCLLFVSRVETSERFIKIAFRIVTGVVICAVLLKMSAGLGTSASYKKYTFPETLHFLSWNGFRYFAPWLLNFVKHYREEIAFCMAFGGFYLYCYVLHGIWRAVGALSIFAAIAICWTRIGLLEGLSFFGSLLLLGSTYMGQFLGHWYLNVPGMHIRELNRVVNILIFALTVRTFTNLWSLITGDVVYEFSNGLDFLFIYSIRMFWGLVPMYVLARMIYRTTVIRSTQSATGIYYAACVMVLVGEAIAVYIKMTWNVLV